MHGVYAVGTHADRAPRARAPLLGPQAAAPQLLRYPRREPLSVRVLVAAEELVQLLGSVIWTCRCCPMHRARILNPQFLG
jgi:hypothetical protein